MQSKLHHTIVPGLVLSHWLFRYNYYFVYIVSDSCFKSKGLETGSRKIASHVVKQRDIIFVFKSAYEPGSEECKIMGEHLVAHGDGVKDVSFTVKGLDEIIEKCKANGVSSNILSKSIFIILLNR